MVEIDLGDKDVGADFGIVGFAATDVMNGLCGNAGALEEFGGEGVRCCHIGSQSHGAYPTSRPAQIRQLYSFLYLAREVLVRARRRSAGRGLDLPSSRLQ